MTRNNHLAARLQFARLDKRNTDGISQQMLTRAVRGLERDGIVTRTIFPASPLQVE